MKLPLNDLKAEYLSIKDEIDEAIQRVLNNSSFILGKEVESFEENFSHYIGTKHCIGVSSCTSALHLSLEVLNIEGGDVLVPVRTVTADAEAVLMAGTREWFHDNDKYESAVDAAIMVHLYGHPNLEVTKKHTYQIIEDCAQATGAEINGKKVGTFGTLSCFSFFPSKPLGCYGDGGAICTNDDELAKKLRALRNHGRYTKYEHSMVGYNYRLDALQAAILNVKLKHLDEWIRLRRKWAKLYCEYLKTEYMEGSAYCHFTIEAKDRQKLSAYLALRGIQTGIHYPYALNEHPPYKQGNFPEAVKWARTTLSLPMHPFLDEEKIKFVCKHIKEFYGEGYY